VIERAAGQIGSSPVIKVTNVIQTTTGRMVFGVLAAEGEPVETA
jgi:uncharacterized protein YacL